MAFLLYALSKFAGRWHLALPTSIANVQDSVVIFLVYAAQPALKPYFYVESQMLDEKEVSLHKGKDGSILVEGWFGAVKPEIAKGSNINRSLLKSASFTIRLNLSASALQFRSILVTRLRSTIRTPNRQHF